MMKKFWLIAGSLVVLTLILAYATKPSYEKAYAIIKEKLTNSGHPVGMFMSHNRDKPNQIYSSVGIKDRIFYLDIFYYDKKVAVAGFSKVFLLNP